MGISQQVNHYNQINEMNKTIDFYVERYKKE